MIEEPFVEAVADALRDPMYVPPMRRIKHGSVAAHVQKRQKRQRAAAKRARKARRINR